MREASSCRTVTDTDSYAFFVQQRNRQREDDRGNSIIMQRVLNLMLKMPLCFLAFILLTAVSSCSNGDKKASVDSERVEVSDTDRSVQYYIPMNAEKWARGVAFTTDDLRPSGRLLLTSGGNVKAAEYSSGFQKVYSFRCEPIGGGWYEVTCRLRNNITDSEYKLVCYTRENI